jgi:hypothetical protein
LSSDRYMVELPRRKHDPFGLNSGSRENFSEQVLRTF